MGSAEQQTIVVIGLSGAGLKTFKLLLERLSSLPGPTATRERIRLVGIERSSYAYWPPGSLRASVVPGFEEKIVRGFEHIIPLAIQRDRPELARLFTGAGVVGLELTERFLVLDRALDGLGMQPGDTQLKFDYLVIASGSTYPFPCRPPPEAERPEELKSHLRALQEQISESQSVVIVGAGVVGIELAGEVSSRYKDKAVTLVCSTAGLLPDMNPKLGASLAQQLGRRNVHIIYGSRANLATLGISKTGKLDRMSRIRLTGDDGGSSEVEADFVFLAIGNKPNTKFVPAGYLDPETKLITVDAHLQVVGAASGAVEGVYAVGDASACEESKLYAALDGQARTVAKNLWSDVRGLKAEKAVHRPIKDTISIPLGPCGGASELFGVTFGLGPWSTSLLKGWTLFTWMFDSMYPAQGR